MDKVKCPLCGAETDGANHYVRSCDGCGLTASHRKWNRLARLVRKGRMFEWLERQNWRNQLKVGVHLWACLKYARAALAGGKGGGG